MATNTNKEKLKKKFEQFRKANEIDAIIQRGDIEEQALSNSAGESRPADESHAMDLLEGFKSSNTLIVRPSANMARPASQQHKKRPQRPAQRRKKIQHKKKRPSPAARKAKTSRTTRRR